MTMEHFDITAAPLEIERKFLIRYPGLDAVRAMPDYRMIHISQTYLDPSPGCAGGRVRRICDGGAVRYVYTFKQKISEISRHEYERELSEDEYRDLLQYRRADCITIEKDRHRFLYDGLTYELDIYAFWDDKATLEAEVDSEDREILIPPCVSLIREVTLDKRYNNSRLAKNRGIIE
jgi:CYTH domain-containing protein